MEKIEQLHKLPHLILDAGNLLFKQERLSAGLLMQAKITAAGIIDSYNQMGYDAVAVGRDDLAAGLKFLQDESAESKFTWVSANLVSKSDAKPLFSPSLIRKIGNLSVSRVFTGFNTFKGYAHARDLRYVKDLMRQYHTEEKIIQTFMLLEETGVNAIMLSNYEYRMFNKYLKDYNFTNHIKQV